MLAGSKAPVTNTTEYSRLAFRSRYSMDCSALYNQVSWNVFISILNYRVKDFQTLICKTGKYCFKPKTLTSRVVVAVFSIQIDLDLVFR